ncbi:MAG: alanine racemase, partial [Anaerolineales bacterium]|nr:alanine racemase [Anaerolineales bacterium]
MLAENLQNIQHRIARAAERAGRDPREITLVAVSKTFPAEAVLAAYALGIRHFGENRVEEAAQKIASRASALGKTSPILLEVNVSGEASKYGFAPEPREQFLDAVRAI